MPEPDAKISIEIFGSLSEVPDFLHEIIMAASRYGFTSSITHNLGHDSDPPGTLYFLQCDGDRESYNGFYYEDIRQVERILALHSRNKLRKTWTVGKTTEWDTSSPFVILRADQTVPLEKNLRISDYASTEINTPGWLMPIGSSRYRLLESIGIANVSELKGCTEYALLQVRNLGKRSVNQIKETLGILGYSLRED